MANDYATEYARQQQKRELDAAEHRAAQTADRLRRAPRASYPGQAAQPALSKGQPAQGAGYAEQQARDEQLRQRRAAAHQAPVAQPGQQPQPDQHGQAAYGASRAGVQQAANPGPSAATLAKPGNAPLPEGATPGIDAVLAVNRRSADRATAGAAANTIDAAAQAKRREQLRGELMAQSLKLANPNATPLELDMARRRR